MFKFIKSNEQMLGIWYNKLNQYIADYNGEPVCINVTGAGSSLAMIASIPGASRMLYGFNMPYAVAATQGFSDILPRLKSVGFLI